MCDSEHLGEANLNTPTAFSGAENPDDKGGDIVSGL